MKTDLFNYTFDKKHIAFFPATKREDAKLMIINRKEKNIHHDIFSSIGSYLKKGDVLVFNNTQVLPNRIFATRKSGGKLEFLFLTNPQETDKNICLIKAKNTLKAGEEIILEKNAKIIIDETLGEGKYSVILNPDSKNYLKKQGLLPLPHYIKREYEKEIDDERYQTVFAQEEGAIASPTAALHFSQTMVEGLKAQGIIFIPVTLHVGIGTFKPIKTDELESHTMHSEYFKITKTSADLINKARKEGKKIIALGTTVVRTLESAYKKHGHIAETEGLTNLFIYPGYTITTCDALITNFHQPCSTLLALVSTFCDRKFLLQAYHEAIQKNYRLFSYGDSMLID